MVPKGPCASPIPALTPHLCLSLVMGLSPTLTHASRALLCFNECGVPTRFRTGQRADAKGVLNEYMKEFKFLPWFPWPPSRTCW